MKAREKPLRKIRSQNADVHSTGRALIKGIIILCALGCIWVWKESWNEKLSNRILELNKSESEMMTSAGYLRKELVNVSQYPIIVQKARNQLGMVIPQSAPEIVWSKDSEPEILLGSAALYKFHIKGLDL